MSDEKRPAPPPQPRVQIDIVQKGYRPQPTFQGGYQGPTSSAAPKAPSGGSAVKPPPK